MPAYTGIGALYRRTSGPEYHAEAAGQFTFEFTAEYRQDGVINWEKLFSLGTGRTLRITNGWQQRVRGLNCGGWTD